MMVKWIFDSQNTTNTNNHHNSNVCSSNIQNDISTPECNNDNQQTMRINIKSYEVHGPSIKIQQSDYSKNNLGNTNNLTV